jgi:broad specificity phosphatase PhoE
MLYLVRHGRAAAGVEGLDPGLDDLGRLQAEAAAASLKGVRAARLVVSPMRRTRETAEPIARALGLAAEVRVEVSEVFDPSMSRAERQEMIGPFLAGYWSAQANGLRAWRGRVADALMELAVAGEVVVVSHYVAICAAIGIALDDDRVLPVELANCSITTMDAPNGRLVVVDAGNTDHLPADLVTGKHTVLPGRA